MTSATKDFKLDERIYYARLKGALVGGLGGYCIGGPPGGFVGGIAGAWSVDFYFTCFKGYPSGYLKIRQEYSSHQQILVYLAQIGVLAAHDGLAGATFGYVSTKVWYHWVDRAKKVTLMSRNAAGIDLDKLVEDFKSKNPLVPEKGIAERCWERVKDLKGVLDTNDLNQKKQKLFDDLAAKVAKAARDNRANQLNPNHVKTGQGRSKDYQGSGTIEDF